MRRFRCNGTEQAMTHARLIHALSQPRWPSIAAILLSGLCALASQPAAAHDDATVRVMTLNMDEGTRFEELAAARTVPEFLAAVSVTYQNILATNPAERAAAIARKIAAERPDLLGVQEASMLRVGAAAPAMTVKSDLLTALVDELSKLGHRYAVVATVPGLDAEAPSTLGFHVRLTTQDAILVRSDARDEGLKLSNLQIEHYAVNQISASPAGAFAVMRGWASIDAHIRGRAFRFATTHLDAVLPPVQVLQATELVGSAANTPLPMVITGDLNATADSSLDPTFPTYQVVINAGFTDAWPGKRAPDPGFTCCQASDLRNAASQLNHRIDFVLTRGGIDVVDIRRVGDQANDRTRSGLWLSDHAGVVATLRIPGKD
jgi:endonuclease/exonuclease/phosphatase family metal-dependent hydrolase